ncbi:MAG: hypothetical protein ACJ72N_27535 [Labedaea sp.]
MDAIPTLEPNTEPPVSMIPRHRLTGVWHVFAVTDVSSLQPGDIGFSTIGGRVGPWVALGQAMLRDECWFTHTWIVSEADGAQARVVEAMPGGAREALLVGPMRCTEGYGWIRLPLTLSQRASVTEYAQMVRGTPYSFLDYQALALVHLGFRKWGSWMRNRVEDSGHMICSQLVDHVLCQAGFHLFTDGRLPQDVTPGALFRRAGALGEVTWR